MKTKKDGLLWLLVLLLSPLLYPFTTRINGHSFKDYIDFISGK
jgi:hypothetical protein